MHIGRVKTLLILLSIIVFISAIISIGYIQQYQQRSAGPSFESQSHLKPLSTGTQVSSDQGQKEATTLSDLPPLYPGLNWRKKAESEPDYISYTVTIPAEWHVYSKNQDVSFAPKDSEEWEADLTHLSIGDYNQKHIGFYSYYDTTFKNMGWRVDLVLNVNPNKWLRTQAPPIYDGPYGYIGIKDRKLRVLIPNCDLTLEGIDRCTVFFSNIISIDNVPPATL